MHASAHLCLTPNIHHIICFMPLVRPALTVDLLRDPYWLIDASMKNATGVFVEVTKAALCVYLCVYVAICRCTLLLGL